MELSKKRILVVDDDLDIQDIFSEILDSEGYEVSQAKNGKEAFSLLLACDPRMLPDLIILDSEMPQMNGREFLQAIREHDSEDLKRISILLNSGNAADAEDELLTSVPRLQKPVEFTVLIDSVAQSLRP